VLAITLKGGKVFIAAYAEWRTLTIMTGMMKQCCGRDGKPDFERMKQYMEHCGKEAFSDGEIQMMKQFCAHEKMPDVEMMKQMMERCGCHPS
jgi:hypothetical protein